MINRQEYREKIKDWTPEELQKEHDRLSEINYQRKKEVGYFDRGTQVPDELRRELHEELEYVMELKNRIKYWEIRTIKKYANHTMYTDVNPYEVVRVVSDKCVEVRAMKAIQTRAPQDFHAGGFVGHFADNRSGQEYEYHSDPEAKPFKIRWSERNRQWQQGTYMRFSMSDKPYKFYDYNF